jgi:glutamate racemase
MTDRRPIGIFDSGVGGLTVLGALRRELPNEDLLYLGDTARVPYGSRGPETIRRYSENVVAHLVDADCKAVVVACNTASAWAIEHLRRNFDVPILDVIEPVAEAVVAAQATRVAVLATRGTVQSGAYQRIIRRIAPSIHVVPQACPLFVPLAEEGLMNGPIAEAIALHYLRELPRENQSLDAIILGCTHYPLLRSTIVTALAQLGLPDVALYDSGAPTAAALKRVLLQHRLAAPERTGSTSIRVTDDPAALGDIAARFLGMDPGTIEHVDIGTR